MMVTCVPTVWSMMISVQGDGHSPERSAVFPTPSSRRSAVEARMRRPPQGLYGLQCSKRDLLSAITTATVSIPLLWRGSALAADTAIEIDHKVDATLKKLYQTRPFAKDLSKQAAGILVFPRITKAGFLVGGAYGEGALRRNGKTTGYYSSIAGSYGLQVGVQWFGYALFFMNDQALQYLDSSNGWEIGVGPHIVVVDEGMAKRHTTTTLTQDAYAFIFAQKGLMAGLGIEGSKISRMAS